MGDPREQERRASTSQEPSRRRALCPVTTSGWVLPTKLHVPGSVFFPWYLQKCTQPGWLILIFTLPVSSWVEWFIFFLNAIYLSIYFWLCWVLAAVWAFSSHSEQGLPLAAACGGLFVLAFLVAEHRLQGAWALVAVAPGLWGNRLSSCGTWTQLQGVWGPPRPGIALVSPALAAGFLTMEPPGKPWVVHLSFTDLWICLALDLPTSSRDICEFRSLNVPRLSGI